MESYDNHIELARALFSGAGAELGVAAGDFSDDILRHCPAVTLLWSIDRWSDHHDLAEYWRAADRRARYGERSRVRRCTFTGQDGGHTLEEWWPKLRRGGIFGGHDYHPDWPATAAAVDAFVDRHGLKMGFSNEYAKERGEWPSWWVRKP